jgi:hypothetical protein
LGGVVTVAGCYALGRKLGGPPVGLATAALYAVSPWAVLHERMALLDGPVATLVLVAAVVTWESVDRSSWPLALGAALAGSAAVLTKQPGLLALSVPLFFAVSRRNGRTLLLTGIAAAGPALSGLALRFAPGANRLQYQISNRWTPLGSVAENWGRLQEAAQTYLPAALLLFVLLGAASLLRRGPERALLVGGQMLAWTASWILLSNFAPSRYHLPALPCASPRSPRLKPSTACGSCATIATPRSPRWTIGSTARAGRAAMDTRRPASSCSPTPHQVRPAPVCSTVATRSQRHATTCRA